MSETFDWECLQARARVLRAIRAFFEARGFLEVETPVRIPAPANEAFLEPPPSGDRWLRTSPELHMKRLLAAGAGPIYQMGPCFRANERGRRHNPEFTLLEWYRPNAGIATLYDDVEALVSAALGRPLRARRIPVAEIYREVAGWDPLESWDEDRFDEDMALKIEPALPREGLTYLTDYPAPAAALARLNPAAPRVAERFEAEYLKDAAGLNCEKPTVQPRATEHIDEILSIVKDLIDSGHAYVAKNGDVYFRVRSFKDYGKLSHLNLEDLESGNRELRSQMEDDLKEDPADFAVWKAAKPGEPAWDSPYGPGRPGWHIECSAMSRKHLGKTLDLHAGGQDLIFPHHENEIAQSESANGCEFSHYWMHNGFLNINNQKMSKSLNNFFTVREIADAYGYEPIRFFMLTAGYRMPLNYTVELIQSCKNSLERLYTCRENLDFAIQNASAEGDETLIAKAAEAREKFNKAMDDDLNTPDALAVVFDLVKEINTLSASASKKALEEAAKAFDELTNVLGLMYNRKKDEVPAEVMALVEQRAAAKKAKNWAEADALRDKITGMGWSVTDTAQGPKVSKL